MSRSYFIFSLVILGFLTGCISTPKTAPELREHVRDQKMGGKLERFVVQRPYSAVTQTLKKKSEECLAKTFRLTSKPTGFLTFGGEQDHGINKYIPVSNIGPTRAEFYTKLYHGRKRSITTDVGDQFIYYVADITPKGANATSIDLYYWDYDHYRWGRDFVKAWARGEDPGCPIMSGDY
jgi:hypothetical protein